MRYPKNNRGETHEWVDYTYHHLSLTSVLNSFPESYPLDTTYDPAGRTVGCRLGTFVSAWAVNSARQVDRIRNPVGRKPRVETRG